jgi:hypothetical protein
MSCASFIGLAVCVLIAGTVILKNILVEELNTCTIQALLGL